MMELVDNEILVFEVYQGPSVLICVIQDIFFLLFNDGSLLTICFLKLLPI